MSNSFLFGIFTILLGCVIEISEISIISTRVINVSADLPCDVSLDNEGLAIEIVLENNINESIYFICGYRNSLRIENIKYYYNQGMPQQIGNQYNTSGAYNIELAPHSQDTFYLCYGISDTIPKMEFNIRYKVNSGDNKDFWVSINNPKMQ